MGEVCCKGKTISLFFQMHVQVRKNWCHTSMKRSAEPASCRSRPPAIVETKITCDNNAQSDENAEGWVGGKKTKERLASTPC